MSLSEIEEAYQKGFREGLIEGYTDAANEINLLSRGTKSEERSIAIDEAVAAIVNARDQIK